MEIKFSPELLCILNYARDEAMRTGSYGIGADHIMLALLRHADNNACRALAACGIVSDGLKEAIDRKIFSEKAVPWQDRAMVRPTRAAAAQLSAAAYEALKYGQHEILSSHFLLALVRSGSGAAADLTVIDPDAQWTVDPAEFLSQGRATPFAGMRVRSRIVLTLKDGEPVWQE